MHIHVAHTQSPANIIQSLKSYLNENNRKILKWGKFCRSISIARRYLRLNNNSISFFEMFLNLRSMYTLCGNMGAAMHYNKVHLHVNTQRWQTTKDAPLKTTVSVGRRNKNNRDDHSEVAAVAATAAKRDERKRKY